MNDEMQNVFLLRMGLREIKLPTFVTYIQRSTEDPRQNH